MKPYTKGHPVKCDCHACYKAYLVENSKAVAKFPRWMIEGAYGISVLDKRGGKA